MSSADSHEQVLSVGFYCMMESPVVKSEPARLCQTITGLGLFDSILCLSSVVMRLSKE